MKRVLLIEDESAMQKILRRILEERGYEVLSALDGVQGLTTAREQKPDAIIVDLILPRKDGFAVLEELKGDDATMNIPAIVLTNLEGMSDVEQALKLGATTYLVKANYTADEIVSKIEEVMNRK